MRNILIRVSRFQKILHVANIEKGNVHTNRYDLSAIIYSFIFTHPRLQNGNGDSNIYWKI